MQSTERPVNSVEFGELQEECQIFEKAPANPEKLRSADMKIS